MTKHAKTLLDWATFNNAFSIIFTLVSTTVIISFYFANIKTELALIRQRQEYLIEQHAGLLDWKKDVESRYGELALKIERLETKVGDK